MTTCIKTARSTDEIDGVFRARYRIYVEQEHYMKPRNDRRIFDRFDAYPSTANIILADNSRVVGGVRFMEQAVAGTSGDEFFEFSAYLPQKDEKTGSGSMLFLESSYRDARGLSFKLMAMGFYWAHCRKISFITGVINPESERFFLRFGFRMLASPMYDDERQLHFIPVLLDMRELPATVISFIESQRGDIYRVTGS